MHKEIDGNGRSGYSAILIILALHAAGLFLVITAPIPVKALAALTIIVAFIGWFGLYMVQPNQGKVLQLFGHYKGTDREAGLRWNNPFYSKRSVSLRVRNFESGRLKVNDANGNPIEIAAVIVWRVVDTAEAVFEVDDYENYVSIQSEAALRNLTTSYPYEHDADDHRLTLRGHSGAIAEKLRAEVQERLGTAGVQVLEARLSHLAYSPEIAQAMLQRQQANAILAARRIIVRGAVGMVKDAIEQLSADGVVELDDERKAAMVSNLLVVLCGEHNAQPVINAGSLY